MSNDCAELPNDAIDPSGNAPYSISTVLPASVASDLIGNIWMLDLPEEPAGAMPDLPNIFLDKKPRWFTWPSTGEFLPNAYLFRGDEFAELSAFAVAAAVAEVAAVGASLPNGRSMTVTRANVG